MFRIFENLFSKIFFHDFSLDRKENFSLYIIYKEKRIFEYSPNFNSQKLLGLSFNIFPKIFGEISFANDREGKGNGDNNI